MRSICPTASIDVSLGLAVRRALYLSLASGELPWRDTCKVQDLLIADRARSIF